MRLLRRKSSTAQQNRRGVAAVEMAFVSPMLVLMILGIVEFGRMSMVQQTITTAAREGARQAIVDGSSQSDVDATVNSYLAPADINSAEVSISSDLNGTVLHGAPVSVTVSVAFSDVSWLPVPKFVGGKVLTSTSVMRRESPQ
jgi:Flp pilus assembly protein TadG